MNHDQTISYYVIGLMSGTSLDGLDLAYVHFQYQEAQWHYQIIYAQTYTYPDEFYAPLKTATQLSAFELYQLDIRLGKHYAHLVNQFIVQQGINQVDLIASHGHTIFHQPQIGFTIQIGNAQWISQLTHKIVISDFRSQDIALGGQGAPLVPIGDELLFSTYDYCLNLGGFSNISYKENKQRLAYDLSPVNTVLNHYAQLLGKPYDENGAIARNTMVNKALFYALNELPYYQKQSPKSLGIEWVNQVIFPLIEQYESDSATILATFTHHTAFQIARAIKPNQNVLVTGGGAYNEYLIQLIEDFAQIRIEKVADNLIQFKEALIFAFLGVLRLEKQTNILKSVTGASMNHSSGVITYPVK